MLSYVLGGLAIVVIVWVANGRERSLAMVFGAPKWGSVDFAALRKTSRPNQYLLAPPGFCPDAESRKQVDAAPPEFDLPAQTLRDRLLGIALAEPLTERVAADDQALQYDISQKTSLMRYTDMATVRIIPLGENRSTLAIYSRSWYGRKDFGVNRTRVERWLAALSR